VENRLEEFLTFLDSSRRSAFPDVVSFLIEEFRAIWATSGSPDGATALVPFLLALCAADQGDGGILDDPTWCRDTALDIGIDDPGLLDAQLNRPTIERARGMQGRAPLGLRLIPSLVLRHVAGRLFQDMPLLKLPSSAYSAMLRLSRRQHTRQQERILLRFQLLDC
jgi:hypothetical protein